MKNKGQKETESSSIEKILKDRKKQLRTPQINWDQTENALRNPTLDHHTRLTNRRLKSLQGVISKAAQSGKKKQREIIGSMPGH